MPSELTHLSEEDYPPDPEREFSSIQENVARSDKRALLAGLFLLLLVIIGAAFLAVGWVSGSFGSGYPMDGPSVADETSTAS